ncbi:MAG TPA: PH domain-containing protein [Candidatus Saccharimonadales bacterium]|nr:PH domain-containing protein [Candidatus Saccharimonadales bacterium]
MAKETEKYFDDQFDDEEVLFVFRKHPVVMRRGLVLGLLGPLIGVLPAAIDPNLGFNVFFGGLIGGIVLGLLIFAPSWIGWHFSIFIVTDQRFIQITQKGLFHRAVADLSLHQIQSVNYEVAGLQETLLGFGTIHMRTYVGDLTVHNVGRPAKIQKRIVGILRDQGITTTPYPAQGAAKEAAEAEQEPTEDNEETDEDIAEIEEA